MSALRTAALELAAQGIRVFPCGKDKSPRTANGYYDATTDVETLKSWDWDGMIGATVPPGTVVIDVDPRNGGDATLALLKANGKKLPSTKTTRTQSGGFHYWYSLPEETTLRGKLGPGIDVKRAGKGYVIVPPSPGYASIGSVQVDAPEWLVDQLRVEGTTGGAAEASDPKYFEQFEQGTAYGMAALEREMGRLARAPNGERNEALNRAAFALAQLCTGGELQHKRAVQDLLAVSDRIGLNRHEAERTIESGWEAGAQEPRQAPVKDEDNAHLNLGERALESEDEARFWVNWEVDEPPPPYILDPIIPKNAYVLVYGATEASKSMVFNALGAEASRRGYRVSVYSLENPAHTDRDRLRRLAPDPSAFRLTNSPLDFNDPRQFQALIDREKEWGSDIIVVDTYSHAYSSRSDDGNAKAIEFARRVRHVMHEVGCTFVVIDHTGYTQDDEPRDASAKRQQVDVALLMRKAGEWRPGQPSRFTIENRKSARFANPCFLRGAIHDTTGDVRGLELRWEQPNPLKWESA